MEKMKFYTKNSVTDENVSFQLDYSLVIRSAEQGNIYGVAVKKTDSLGIQEEEIVEGLCENKDEAVQFLFGLAEGLALPIELTALCDDFISEREYGKQMVGQTAC